MWSFAHKWSKTKPVGAHSICARAAGGIMRAEKILKWRTAPRSTNFIIYYLLSEKFP
jgi:hypothetical protein